MKRLVTIGFLGAASAVFAPSVAEAQNKAACGLYNSSYIEASNNPPKGEDADFFVNTGGIPGIYLQLSTSGSMQHLPPDGPATYGLLPPTPNPTLTLPDGITTITQPIVGCGLDPVSIQYDVQGYAMHFLASVPFYNACGKSLNEEVGPPPGVPLIGSSYEVARLAKGSMVDYGMESRVCPYYVNNANPNQTGDDGFDPEFYCNNPHVGTTCGAKNKFFEPTYVFHEDAIGATEAAVPWLFSAGVGCLPGGTNASTPGVACDYTTCTPNGYGLPQDNRRDKCPGDGWSGAGTFPWQVAAGAGGTWAQFCNAQGTVAYQGGLTKEQICNTCMDRRGFYFDGRKYDYLTGSPRIPTLASSIWYSGNFLNMYPPKFRVAKKVLKDTVNAVRRIRLGITTFTTGAEVGHGAQMKPAEGGQPLNPSCNFVYPPSQSNFDSNRGSIINSINTKMVSFSGPTPLAESILNIGQYYRTNSMSWFGDIAWNAGGYTKTNADPGGDMNSGAGNQAAVCFSCQSTAIVVLTDGLPSSDTQIPPGTFPANPDDNHYYAGQHGITGIDTTFCPRCGAGGDVNKYLVKTAYYLHHTDMRLDTETGSDGQPMTGRQQLNIYMIGFGTDATTNAVLEDATYRDDSNDRNSVGGGLFFSSNNAAELKTSIVTAMEDINARETSFGVANVSTLQTTTTVGVLIPRFEPTRAAHWNGFLYRFDLYSEFADGCQETQAPAPFDSKDKDCDRKCSGVFLLDKDRDFISEDSQGNFKKNNPPNLVLCVAQGGNSQCTPCAGGVQATDAVPVWQAGERIKTQTWQSRQIYTAVDTNLDGKIDLADGTNGMIPVIDNDATADALLSYLPVGRTRDCIDLAAKLTAIKDTYHAAKITAELNLDTYRTCIKMMIKYMRGADIFDENLTVCPSYPRSPRPGGAKSTWPPPPSPELSEPIPCDRSFKLGDVFHSSPVIVEPPYTSEGIICRIGIANQCLPSIFLTPTPSPSVLGNANAYDDYAKDKIYRRRTKVALVGANDGFLHGIHAGTWRGSGGTATCGTISTIPADTNSTPGNDPCTSNINEAQLPFDGYWDVGTGLEVWAFIPPDLLSKIPMFLGKNHHFYVDGTPMVREVWVDGGPNGSGAKDHVKQKDEFHAVAVVGERRGGTHYFALDVTRATPELDGKPRFLWTFPQPGTKDELVMGETYSDFLPSKPPIGPVRIDAGAAGGGCGNKEVYATPSGNRCAEERWMVALAGGWDPHYSRGHGVYMADVWTGQKLFDFSEPPGCAGADPRCGLRYPITAAMGLLAWGKADRKPENEINGGFFDTMTFGDTGGQLWVVRFNDPGTINLATGSVDNWFGGRVFQMGGVGPAKFCNGSPFFYITANSALKTTGHLRVLAGTGDRFNLLEAEGGTCGPDNLRACVQKGCSVNVNNTWGTDLDKMGQWQAQINNPGGTCAVVPGLSSTYVPNAGGTCTLATGVSLVDISCPTRGADPVPPDPTAAPLDFDSHRNMQTECFRSTGNPNAYTCQLEPNSDPGWALTPTVKVTQKNYFVSLRVFNDTDRRIFRTLAEATNYDTRRLSEFAPSVKQLDGAQASFTAAQLANDTTDGWALWFNHNGVGGNLASGLSGTTVIDTTTYNMNAVDERIASTSAVAAGCVYWNTMQPVTLPASATTPCKAGRRQQNYFYGANVNTGDLCLNVPGTGIIRAQTSGVLVPPSPGELHVFVNSKGQVNFGLTSVRVPQGGTNITIGDIQDPQSMRGWLDLPKSVHDCRHFDRNSTGPRPPAGVCE